MGQYDDEALNPKLLPDFEIPANFDGHKEFKQLARECRRRLGQHDDAVVVFTGYEGVGKSSAAIQLGRLIDPDFTLTKNVVFDDNIEKLSEMIYELPVESAVMVDELARLNYTREWYAKKNIMFNRMFILCRKRRKASLLCIPNFNLMDSHTRTRAFYWVHCIKRGNERGYGIVLKRDDNQFSTDPWNIEDNEKMLRKLLHDVPVHGTRLEDYANAMQNSKNFLGIIQFSQLDAVTQAEYDSLTENQMENVASNENPKEVKYRTAIGKLFAELLRNGYDKKKLLELSGLDNHMTYKIMKQMGTSVTLIKKEMIEKRKALENPTVFEEIPDGPPTYVQEVKPMRALRKNTIVFEDLPSEGQG